MIKTLICIDMLNLLESSNTTEIYFYTKVYIIKLTYVYTKNLH